MKKQELLNLMAKSVANDEKLETMLTGIEKKCRELSGRIEAVEKKRQRIKEV